MVLAVSLGMKFRYLRDRHNNRLHIWNRHKLTQKEVELAFSHVISEYRDEDNAWVKTCTAANQQKMEIVYIKHSDHVFIITAYYV